MNKDLYQPFYCEENIWHLAKKLDEPDGEVWFVLGHSETVAVGKQRASEGHPVIFWDYHVIYYSPIQGVYDLDTTCSFPCDAHRYLDESFLQMYRTWPFLSEDYPVLFRVIPAREYIREFASTREHMKLKDGSYLKPQPAWACIGEEHRLGDYLDTANRTIGTLQSLDELLARLRL